jgi:TPR repeat protein
LTGWRQGHTIPQNLDEVPKLKMFRHLALAAVLALGAVGVRAQDFEKGLAAAQSGDFQTALKEWVPLAEQGDADAQVNLGLMYNLGNGVPQDYGEALKWYSLSALQGNADAQTYVGFMFYLGEGVPQDLAEAGKWLRLAADQGNARAQSRLGQMYEFGDGVLQNNVTAHMWYNIASANGNEESAKWRDDLAANMTPEDISKAQAMASECMSSGYENCGG